MIRPRLFDLADTVSNNDVLISEAAKNEAKFIIAYTKFQLAKLNREIKRGEPIPDELLAQQKQCLIHIESNRIAIAPHRKLPNEILYEIFSHCVPEFLRIPPEPTTPPWTLLRVCLKWRQVALMLPRLWCRIRLQYPPSSQGLFCPIWKTYIDPNKIARQVISRAIHFPVTLEVRDPGGAFVRWEHPITAVVIPNLHKVRSLTLECGSSYMDPLYECPIGSVPLLEDLTIKVAERNHLPLGKITVFEAAPRLRKVAIGIRPFHPQLYNFPWHQLTDLHLPDAELHPTIGYQLLMECKSLVYCSLSLKREAAPPQRTEKPVLTLHHLLSLSLHISKYHDYRLFLKWLVLPRLTRFQVLDPESLRIWHTDIIPVVTHSRSLQTLHLEVSIQHTDLEVLLKETPTLITLYIQRGIVIPAPLFNKVSRGDLVPRLEVLGCVVVKDDLNQYLDMIANRPSQRQSTGLGSHPLCVVIFLERRDHRTIEVEARVAELRRSGCGILFLDE